MPKHHKTIDAWYLSETSRRLRFGDNRKIRLNKTHRVFQKPVLCERGLHASVVIIDALRNAPGPILWRVRLSGKMVRGDYQIAAKKRTYLSGGVDIFDVLTKFVEWYESNFELPKEPTLKINNRLILKQLYKIHREMLNAGEFTYLQISAGCFGSYAHHVRALILDNDDDDIKTKQVAKLKEMIYNHLQQKSEDH